MEDLTVENELFTGSSSKIYKRGDTAIKNIHIEDPEKRNKKRKLLLQEIEILSSLSHTNVIKFISANVTIDNVMITLEYANMGDLTTYIPENNLEFLLQLFQGMKYLHDNLILHMDIKPANIFVKNHIPKLADFDISKKLSSKYERTRSQAGTPRFLSPEGLLKRHRGLKSDIWSLGLTFYYVLTRKNLMGDNVGTYFRNKKYVNIPEDVEFYDILSKMIVVNQYYRYSIDELIDNVEKENFEEEKNSMQEYQHYVLFLDGMAFFNEPIKQGTLISNGQLFYEVNSCEELINQDNQDIKESIEVLEEWEDVYIINHD